MSKGRKRAAGPGYLCSERKPGQGAAENGSPGVRQPGAGRGRNPSSISLEGTNETSAPIFLHCEVETIPLSVTEFK